MLAPKFVRTHLDAVVKNCNRRNYPFDKEKFSQLEKSRVALIQDSESLKARRKLNAKQIAELIEKPLKNSDIIMKIFFEAELVDEERKEIIRKQSKVGENYDLNKVKEIVEESMEYAERKGLSDESPISLKDIRNKIDAVNKFRESDLCVLSEKGKKLKEQEHQVSEEKEKVEIDMKNFCLALPNMLADKIPDGNDEDDNKYVRSWGAKTKFDFIPKNHVEIMENLGIADFERAAKLTGARFSLMQKDGAKLERALMNFLLDENTSQEGGNYQEVRPASIVNKNCLVATGQLPKFSQDLFTLSASGENFSNYYLIPTSEVPLTNLHSGEILSPKDLPKKFTAHTPCFRSEAGAAGKDSRGLIRLHEFHKVELVKITQAEESGDEHDAMVKNIERLLQKLELPYRVMLLCAGDTGFSASKCYDIEVWLPGQNKYREISSCSNCADFQTRRAQLRYRCPKEKTIKLTHSINGSGLPIGRTIVALLENNQQADGSIKLPEALEPYMGKQFIQKQ